MAQGYDNGLGFESWQNNPSLLDAIAPDGKGIIKKAIGAFMVNNNPFSSAPTESVPPTDAYDVGRGVPAPGMQVPQNDAAASGTGFQGQLPTLPSLTQPTFKPFSSYVFGGS